MLSTHSLNTCQWGDSHLPACGPPVIFSVHLTSSSVTLGGLSTNPGWQCGAYVGEVEEMMCVVCVSEYHKGVIVMMDVIWIQLCVCMIWRRVCWAMVRRVRRGSISSELIVCGGGVRSILLLPLVARCLETIDACILCMFVFMSVVVTVWGSVGMCLCSLVKDSVLALECWNRLYVSLRDVMYVVFSCFFVLWVFHHEYVVCLRLVCILWQLSMLWSAWLAVC